MISVSKKETNIAGAYVMDLDNISDLNPGFDGPWKKLWIFFVNGTFIMPKKKSFGKKNFWISCRLSKVPFWQNGKIAKMALLNPSMNFKIFFGQKTSFETLWKCHLQKLFINFSRVRPIQDLGQSKYKLALFSKRTHGISKILLNLSSCEFLARLGSKIKKCLFFDGSLL